MIYDDFFTLIIILSGFFAFVFGWIIGGDRYGF